MPDEIDIANEQADLFLSSALAQVRKAAARVDPMGECMNCGADLTSNVRRFCDSDCAEDWHSRQRVQRKQRGE